MNKKNKKLVSGITGLLMLCVFSLLAIVVFSDTGAEVIDSEEGVGESVSEIEVGVGDTPSETSKPEPTASPLPAIGTRDNPVPFGNSMEMGREGYVIITMTLLETIRGNEAWQRLYTENMFNDEPPNGQEYVLIFASLHYVQEPAENTLFEISGYDFDIVSEGQVINTPFASVNPSPEFDFSIFVGAEVEGWFAMLVNIGDVNPLLVFGVTYDSQAIYFSLTPDAE